MERVALLGKKISHSMSQVMHNAAFKDLGLDWQYEVLDTDSLESAIKLIKEEGYRGCNVTIPYKQEVMKHLDYICPAAQHIGAVNTIINKGGTLMGYNTDYTAAVEPLKSFFESLSGLKAHVLGAGGASRAVVYGLQEEHVDVTVTARRIEQARDVSHDLGCNYLTWGSEVKADILINTTPVGTHPSYETPMEQKHLRSYDLVYDIIYNPLNTRLLMEAEQEGCQTLGGLEMFVRQGEESFTLWTRRHPNIFVMGDAVRNRLEQ